MLEYKCQNTLSICIFMGFIATEGTHAVACGKGNLVLRGLLSPALPTVPQWPQSCGNWGRSIVSVVVSEDSEPTSPVFQFWGYRQLASTLDGREADVLVLKYLFFHPPHLTLLKKPWFYSDIYPFSSWSEHSWEESLPSEPGICWLNRGFFKLARIRITWKACETTDCWIPAPQILILEV